MTSRDSRTAHLIEVGSPSLQLLVDTFDFATEYASEPKDTTRDDAKVWTISDPRTTEDDMPIAESPPGPGGDPVFDPTPDSLFFEPSVLDGHSDSDGPWWDHKIYGTEENDVLIGSNLKEVISAEEGNDLVHGGGARDRIFGGDGNDSLYGDEGDDEIFGGDGDDDLFGGVGDDSLSVGGSGHNRAFGNEGDDLIIGSYGNDEIFGGDGDDHILSGTGADTLSGGSGADVFEWWAWSDTDKDTIADFEIGTDKLMLHPGQGLFSFLDMAPDETFSDVVIALGNGAHTELLAKTKPNDWIVFLELENLDHLQVQAAIEDGSLFV